MHRYPVIENRVGYTTIDNCSIVIQGSAIDELVIVTTAHPGIGFALVLHTKYCI